MHYAAASTLAVSAPMAGKLLHAAGDVLVAVAAGRRHLTPLHHYTTTIRNPTNTTTINNNHNYNHNKHYNDE